MKVTKYVLNELNRAMGGDAPPSFAFWTEHILPQTPGEGWEAFDEDERKLLTDRLANLLPLSSEMNQQLSNSPYSVKRPIYQDDSRYKMARKFAEEYEEWNPELLMNRAESLAILAVARWPYGPMSA